ncbi:helix-turn-helix domain-containing protein [Rhodococcus wratislaviensis]|uniref:helix-turn-helix domain-containing protein n=1 Tax=Rhodococcus wratislaviensis TaxID=44752 RepID=UPI003667F872
MGIRPGPTHPAVTSMVEHTGPVTVRALRLLEAFSPDKPELSLSDLARRADLPVSTTHRLAADLLDWGALERDDRGRYHIGLRLWEIASLAPRALVLRELALPVAAGVDRAEQHRHDQVAQRNLRAVVAAVGLGEQRGQFGVGVDVRDIPDGSGQRGHGQ